MKRIKIDSLPKRLRDIKCYSCTWLPPKGYIAITLFGFVIFRGTAADVTKYLQTTAGIQCLNHEYLHIIQGRSLGWLVFYILYIYYFLKYLAHGWGRKYSYQLIPFEMEAHENETDMDYDYTCWYDYVVLNS